MEIRLVFDPHLEIDGESFVAQWRESADNLALGTFRAESSGMRTFGEPSTILTFLGGVAVGVLPNALWDGIKWTYGQIKVEFNNGYSQARMYHQLGLVAQEQRQWGRGRELWA